MFLWLPRPIFRIFCILQNINKPRQDEMPNLAEAEEALVAAVKGCIPNYDPDAEIIKNNSTPAAIVYPGIVIGILSLISWSGFPTPWVSSYKSICLLYFGVTYCRECWGERAGIYAAAYSGIFILFTAPIRNISSLGHIMTEMAVLLLIALVGDLRERGWLLCRWWGRPESLDRIYDNFQHLFSAGHRNP